MSYLCSIRHAAALAISRILNSDLFDRDENDGNAVDPKFIQLEKDAGLFASNAATPDELMQTFVYSATLSKELQRNLKKRPKLPSGASRKNDQPKSTLGTSTISLSSPLGTNGRAPYR
jgi:hypothetical protein